MKIALATVLSLVLALPAGAASVGRASIGGQGEYAPVIAVAPVVAKPGESDADFLLRAGRWMRNFTTGSGYEACSQVCRAPSGGLGLLVSTSNSQIGCGLTGECPDGYTATPDSIHSHPVVSRLKMNDVDRAFMRARRPGQNVKRQEAFTGARMTFSGPDYASGPGYLVTDDVLLYQNGPGTSRKVADLGPIAE